jgi:ubiquinone biosynthesis protein COQ9
VRLREAGNSESQCIWSTTSCDAYLATLKNIRSQVSQTLKEIGQDLKEIIGSVKENAKVLAYRLNLHHIDDIFRNMKEKVIHQIDRFFRWSKDKPYNEKYSKRSASDDNISPGDSNYNSGANRRERRKRAGSS